MVPAQPDGADAIAYGAGSSVTCDRTGCGDDSWLSIGAIRKWTALGAGSLCAADGAAGDSLSLSGSKIASFFSLPCGDGFCYRADHVCAADALNCCSFLRSNIHRQSVGAIESDSS